MGGVNSYAYGEQNPTKNIDPLGLLNGVKAWVAVLNIGRSYMLVLEGRTYAFVSIFSGGIGQQEIAAPAAGMSFWKFKSAASTLKRGSKQLCEAVNDDSSQASARNLLGLLPFGDKFDDPSEPLPWQMNLFHGETLQSIVGNLGDLIP